MKGSLRLVLEQWTLYHRASEEINGYLMEGRYSVSRLRILNGSLEAVQQQVESLEVRSAEYRYSWPMMSLLEATGRRRNKLEQHEEITLLLGVCF